jgi:hypothetical protein
MLTWSNARIRNYNLVAKTPYNLGVSSFQSFFILYPFVLIAQYSWSIKREVMLPIEHLKV